MQTLQIDGATARKEYPSASPAIKAILEKSFPAGFFSQDIKDRIKTIDDCFVEAGEDQKEFYEKYGDLPDDILATMEAKVIAKAYNQGKSIKEKRYFPWFYLSNSSSGFHLLPAFYDYGPSSAGSRLSFAEYTSAIDAGNKFGDSVYKRFIDLP